MAELPAYLFNGRLSRPAAPPSRALGPGQPRIDPAVAAAPGRGLGQVGQALSQVSDQVAEIDRRMKQARDRLSYAQAYGQGLSAIEEAEAATVADPSILPEARHEHFTAQVEPQLEALAANLPPRARADFLLAIKGAQIDRQRKLRTQGRAEMQKDAVDGMEVVLAQIERQESLSDDPLTLSRLAQSRTQLVQDFVESGFYSEADGAKRLMEAEHTSALTRFRTRARLDPEGALERLQAGDIPAGISPAEVPALIDEAQKLSDAYVSRRRAEEREDEHKRSLISADLRAGFEELLYASYDSVARIDATLDDAIEARAAGGLQATDANALQSLAFKLKKGAREGPKETDADTLRTFQYLMLEDPIAARDYVSMQTGYTIATKDSMGLFNAARAAMKEGHFRKNKTFLDGLALIEGQLGTTGDPLMDVVISNGMGATLAEARQEYITRVMGIAGDAGVDTERVEELAPVFRDQIIQTYRSRLKKLIETMGAEGESVGAPMSASVQQAVLEWENMKRSGVPQHDADAFLGRELARFLARVQSAEDQTINTDAVIAEIQQAMRLLHQQRGQ